MHGGFGLEDHVPKSSKWVMAVGEPAVKSSRGLPFRRTFFQKKTHATTPDSTKLLKNPASQAQALGDNCCIFSCLVGEFPYDLRMLHPHKAPFFMIRVLGPCFGGVYWFAGLKWRSFRFQVLPVICLFTTFEVFK